MADSDPTDVNMLMAPQWVVTAMVGPVMAGYQAQLLLFGVFAQQFTSYALSGELGQHNLVNRTVLWATFLLNLVYTAFVFEECYNAGVSQARTLDDFYNGAPQWNALPLLSGLIAAFSEAYLTMRAANLFPNRTAKVVFLGWMSCLIAVVIFGCCAVFADGMLYAQGADDADLKIPWNSGVACWLWASSIADLSISIALAYNLRKRIAHFNEVTDSILRKLTTEINIAFWTPMAALHGLALFTFSSSGRRHITAHLDGGTSSGSPSKGVGAFSPGAVPRRGSLAPVGAGGMIPLQGLSSPRSPMSIRVEKETQIAFDEAEVETEKSLGEKMGAREYEV
ncbi:hypothetical protein JCM8097_004666 [Rhodosporidiobolus ruineniae]